MPFKQLNDLIMAVTVVQVNAYNLDLGTGSAVGQTLAFPTQGCLLGDCSGSAQRALLPGGTISVYSSILFGGKTYYTQQTLAQLVTAWNA